MKRLIFVCFCLLLSAGCAPTYPIERLGIINTIGIDSDSQDSQALNATYVYFQFDPNAKNINEIVSSKAKTLKGTREKANVKSNFQLVPGKLRVLMMGRPLAEKGVASILDTLVRDAKITDTMYLAVADSAAGNVLSEVFQRSTTNVGTHLYQLIDTNVDQEILIRTTLRDFMHKYYDIGNDPVLPLISVVEHMPSIERMALFRDETYAGDISVEEGFFIKLLSGRYQAGRLELSLPIDEFENIRQKDTDQREEDSLFLSLSDLRSHNSIKLVSKKEVRFQSDIKVQARIMEISEQLELDKEEVVKKLEKVIQKDMERQINQLLDKFRELKVDPIGFGSIYNAKHPITQEEWRKLLSEMKLDLNLNVNIIRQGIID
ncbi:Ger(x)C family spore germination protein [Sediminibacillus halophilus]|uniref:Spore germination protein n=1 Tax=Sediminibacillus halophilus TaxID=482461 RepID=A0A1G9VZS1_9BACI|nr:Ger(x)C family spore germination protein [Sediminibacillus halophilus]SDM77799.1 spore germination protein [Sediminibacillus halophilus]